MKSITFLYTNNKEPERKIHITILFTTITKIIKLGVNLTKNVIDLYSENHKTLRKEIKDDINKYKDTYTMLRV